MRQYISLATAVLWTATVVVNVAAQPNGREIMEMQKERHDTIQEEERILMRLIDRRGREKERKMVTYRAKNENGLNKTMIKFTAPRDIANVGLLTWEQKEQDDDQWLYLPAGGRAKRIASTSKKNSFMGTDLAFEDLRPENLDEHTYTLTGTETVEGQECYVIEALPATDKEKKSSGYTKRIFWINKELLTFVKTEFYGRRDKLIKTSVIHEVENIRDDLYRPRKSTVSDLERKTSTVMETVERDLDPGLEESFFTQHTLKKEADLH